jgi:hypothetical protein
MSTETPVLVNETVPRTQATLTIRIVKSFTFRTEKHLILHNINCETTTVGQLKELAKQGTYYLKIYVDGNILTFRGDTVQQSRLNQVGSHTTTCSSVHALLVKIRRPCIHRWGPKIQ